MEGCTCGVFVSPSIAGRGCSVELGHCYTWGLGHVVVVPRVEVCSSVVVIERAGLLGRIVVNTCVGAGGICGSDFIPRVK